MGSNSVIVIYLGLLLLLHPRMLASGTFLDNARRRRACTVVRAHGYRCQEFPVITSDGYILTVFRIPEGRGGGGGHRRRPPVLVQHGIMLDGGSWLVNSPEQCLPTLLADRGFDVWISNVRGTYYSRRHVTLKPSDPEFWSWTWDELSENELPSVLDMIIRRTFQKPHYVGHSMGTLIAMAALSQGRLVDKLKSAALLSPVAYFEHMTSPLAAAAARAFMGEAGIKFGVAEFDPTGKAVSGFVRALCATNKELNCFDLLNILTGLNCCVNKSTIRLFMRNEPQPTSTRNLVHFSQTIRGGILSKYDFANPLSNMLHYGSLRPPEYHLSKIPRDFPMMLGYGGRDALADPEDVNTLLHALESHHKDKLYVKYIEEYAHADFILGVNAYKIIYDPIVDFFNKFN